MYFIYIILYVIKYYYFYEYKSYRKSYHILKNMKYMYFEGYIKMIPQLN